MKDDVSALPGLTDSGPPDQLIERYIAGECTLPERAAMNRWIAVNPVWRRALTAMRRDGEQGRDGSAEPIDEIMESQQLLMQLGLPIRNDAQENGTITRTIRRSEIPLPGTPREQGRRRSFLHYGNLSRPVAYSVLAGGLMVVLAFAAMLKWPHTAVPGNSPVSTYTTGKGERATITLPDGSVVQLNVASSIQVPTGYMQGDRTLRLTGEAVFSVTHHESTPFTVVAGPSTTRVLGTNFLVRHYDTDTAATIVVREGKVAVASTILTRAQQLTVSTRGTGSVQPIDLSLFAFEARTLVLHRMSLAEAVIELNRWYDADIRLADPALGRERIEGEFSRGSLADLSEQLEGFPEFRVVRDGRTLTLYRR